MASFTRIEAGDFLYIVVALDLEHVASLRKFVSRSCVVACMELPVAPADAFHGIVAFYQFY